MGLQDAMRFRGRWRDYQQSVLDSLDGHLGDEKLHVVAAPGSGKTVLGLEVVRRLGRTTLVLAPTTAIRDQWLDTLLRLFLDGEPPRPGWLSISIEEPGEFTVTTYQALHAALASNGPPDACASLAARLEKGGPLTLVLDEAHHLRREWWRALTRLEAALSQPKLVSLTGTPPYDVARAEWLNYESLCGDIDAQISIPELVRNGDLCPHQDHVYFSSPLPPEQAEIASYQAALGDLIEALRGDSAFLAALLSHPWMRDPRACEADLLETPELMSAMLVFVRFAGAKPPRAALDLLGVGASEIPDMSLDWLGVLLDAMLFTRKSEFDDPDGKLETLRDALRGLGALDGRRVALARDESFYGPLAGSLAKLESVVEIARSEAASLGDGLRLVVLADQVLAADMPRRAGDPCRARKLGVVPIFEALRRAAIPDVKLGILTGSLVVLPRSSLAALDALVREEGLVADALRLSPLPHAGDHVAVETTGEAGNRIVSMVTRLFGRGELNLLVGTQALLGEGWDAPTANSLVIASYVGSYMLSNQMRGRVIRTDPAEPEKAANIWHLATAVPEGVTKALAGRFRWAVEPAPGDPIGRDLGPDFERLKRRFDAFEGVNVSGPARIEGGLGRLGLAGRDWSPAGTQATNAETLGRAAQREALRERWQSAIGEASPRARTRAMLRPTYAPRLVGFGDTLLYLTITGLLGGAASAANALRTQGAGGGWMALTLGFVALTVFYGLPKLGRAAYLLVRNGTLESSLTQVGHVVVAGLDNSSSLNGSGGYPAVVAERDLLGRCLIHVENASRRDERAILVALEEVLGPVRNPRYLIVRESRLGRWLRIDYHAVPSAIGQKKADAEHYAALWNRHVGRGRLVFTRNGEGRHILLRARARSLAAGFQRFVDRISQWR